MLLRSSRTAAPAVLLAALAAAGCSGGDDSTLTASSGSPSAAVSSAPEPTPVSSAPAAEPSVAPTPGAPPAATLSAGAGPTTASAEPAGGPLTVTAVRVARQDGFDRVVLELAGAADGVPGWRVGYEDDPRRDGSGDPVDVDGAAVLVVRVLGAGYPFDTGQTQASSVTVPGDSEVVQDVELGSVFEGTYEAFVGVRQEAPFRVTRLTGPTRVVIDVEHP